jgi:heme A synthase
MKLSADAHPLEGVSAPRSGVSFPTVAWGVLAYNLLVIVWGALVRATKSGAGCGGHWPLCNGEVLPQVTEMATVIEFTHRIMSGLALISAVVLWWRARGEFAKSHRARTWAWRSVIFMITEALVGAGLVLWGLVAGDTSVARVYVLGVHLVNTFLLIACLALTAWWADDHRPEAVSTARGAAFGKLGLVVLTIVSAAGAITALGDTLFPAGSFAEGLRADFADTAHFLVRLRVIHPALAVAGGIYMTLLVWPEVRRRRSTRLFGLAVGIIGLVLMQLTLGTVNVMLAAPLTIQLAHLLLADLVWVASVLYVSESAPA